MDETTKEMCLLITPPKNNAEMKQHIAHIALLVKEYDEAIRFYTEKLGFVLIEDTALEDGKRWVLVAPPGRGESCLLLAKASNEAQAACVGNQAGGRVFLFLYTDDFWRDYHKMIDRNIEFVRPPREEAYGTVAVFVDLYGNKWDLLQPKNLTPPVVSAQAANE